MPPVPRPAPPSSPEITPPVLLQFAPAGDPAVAREEQQALFLLGACGADKGSARFLGAAPTTVRDFLNLPLADHPSAVVRTVFTLQVQSSLQYCFARRCDVHEAARMAREGTQPDYNKRVDYRLPMVERALEEARAAGVAWTPLLDALAQRVWPDLMRHGDDRGRKPEDPASVLAPLLRWALVAPDADALEPLLQSFSAPAFIDAMAQAPALSLRQATQYMKDSPPAAWAILARNPNPAPAVRDLALGWGARFLRDEQTWGVDRDALEAAVFTALEAPRARALGLDPGAGDRYGAPNARGALEARLATRDSKVSGTALAVYAEQLLRYPIPYQDALGTILLHPNATAATVETLLTHAKARAFTVAGLTQSHAPRFAPPGRMERLAEAHAARPDVLAQLAVHPSCPEALKRRLIGDRPSLAIQTALMEAADHDPLALDPGDRAVLEASTTHPLFAALLLPGAPRAHMARLLQVALKGNAHDVVNALNRRVVRALPADHLAPVLALPGLSPDERDEVIALLPFAQPPIAAQRATPQAVRQTTQHTTPRASRTVTRGG